MAFSLNVVDPTLRPPDSSSLSPIELYLAGLNNGQQHQLDFELFGDDVSNENEQFDSLFLPGVSSSMVPPEAIEEPSQFTDYSPSPPPSTRSSTPSSRCDSIDENSPQQRRPRAHTHVHHAEPYPTGERVKRHQTKLACIWCRKLSKKCDAQRPCGRCIQFNRCDECVDAPPRKQKVKGIARGSYKRTRERAAQDFDEARTQREQYVAPVGEMGDHFSVGTSAEEILENMRKAEERIEREDARRFQESQVGIGMENGWNGMGREIIDVDALGATSNFSHSGPATLSPGGLPLQGGFLPFTGPSQDLLYYPVLLDAISHTSGSMTPPTPPSPTESLFEDLFENSSASTTPGCNLFPEPNPLFTDSTSVSSLSNLFGEDMTYEWNAIDLFPNVMKMVHDVQLEAFAQNESTGLGGEV
jgi:hypothetical protein